MMTVLMLSLYLIPKRNEVIPNQDGKADKANPYCEKRVLFVCHHLVVQSLICIKAIPYVIHRPTLRGVARDLGEPLEAEEG